MFNGIIEWAKVTGVDSVNKYVDCVGKITRRTYKKVEWLVSGDGVNPPQVGDVGIIIEIQNNSYAYLGKVQR